MSDPELTEQQLAHFRQLLNQLGSTLGEQLLKIESSTEPVTLDQQSVGRVSRIDAIQQQQMALANKTQITQQLQRVESARKRLDQGLYGYCLRCEEPISLKRLAVQPEATLCLTCQSDSESR